MGRVRDSCSTDNSKIQVQVWSSDRMMLREETKNRDNEPEEEGERRKQSEKKAQTWWWSDREGTTKKEGREGKGRRLERRGRSDRSRHRCLELVTKMQPVFSKAVLTNSNTSAGPTRRED
ncbi:hypothetical protein WN51_01364 [Melipona quadrifasciata]|uniref:Uncharacterized protein n=1 Tax=Melipona quadrifasciata TaxID=166423 RepID=A0A0M8ZZ18_9HYME|nr:hypothetical protein WN51_01364 [Melipona quadrifasciata]